MKKTVSIMLLLIFVLLLIACRSVSETNEFEIKEKDDVVYFNYSEATPHMLLKGEADTIIKNERFFEALINAVDGKPIVKDVCNCEASYIIQTDTYTFGLHTHSISIYNGDSIKADNLIGTIFHCSKEEMNELFSILKASNNEH